MASQEHANSARDQVNSKISDSLKGEGYYPPDDYIGPRKEAQAVSEAGMDSMELLADSSPQTGTDLSHEGERTVICWGRMTLPQGWRTESWSWAGIAAPVSAASLGRIILETTDTAFLGRLGVEELAAAALALVFCDFTSAALWQAYAASVNALCAQAAGAGNYRLVAVWTTIGIWSIAVASVPVLISWGFAEPILLAVGFPESESHLAGLFTKTYCLSLIPFVWYTVLQNALQALGNAYPALWINLSLIPVNIGLNQVFIFGVPGHWEGLGFVGSPLATSVTRWLALVLAIAYMWLWDGKHKRCFEHGIGSWLPEAFSPARAYDMVVRQTLPLMLGNLVENLQLQVISFLGARLGKQALAAHQSTMQVLFLLTSCLYGSVKGTTIRVGYNLGAGRIELAKFVGRLNLFVSMIFGLVVGIVLLAAADQVGRIFTSDEEVIRLMARICRTALAPAYSVIAVFFYAMALLQGQSRTQAVAISFVTGAWGVAVPLAFVLIYTTDLGLDGLWLAMLIGYTVVAFVGLYFTIQTDWEQVAKDAMQRSRRRLSSTGSAEGLGLGGVGGGGGGLQDGDGSDGGSDGGSLLGDGDDRRLRMLEESRGAGGGMALAMSLAGTLTPRRGRSGSDSLLSGSAGPLGRLLSGEQRRGGYATGLLGSDLEAGRSGGFGVHRVTSGLGGVELEPSDSPGRAGTGSGVGASAGVGGSVQLPAASKRRRARTLDGNRGAAALQQELGHGQELGRDAQQEESDVLLQAPG